MTSNIITSTEGAQAIPAPPPKKDKWVRVESPFDYRGLYVRVHTTAGDKTSRSFYYRYQYTTNSKTVQRKLFIGSVRHMQLFEACRVHAEFCEEVARGLDPVARFRTEREALVNKPESIRFKVVVDRWLKQYASINNKPRSYRQIECVVNKHLAGIGKLKVDAITTRSVVELQDKLYDTAPATSNKVLSLIKQILSWACSKSYIDVNVALHVKPRHKNKPRKLIFTDQNIFDILQNLDEAWLKENGKRIIRLLFATGCRRSEIASLRVNDCVDNPNGDGSMIVKIEGDRIKTGVDHIFYLVPHFADMIRAAVAEKVEPENPYVFESPRWRFKHLDANHIGHEFKRIIRYLGLSEKLVLHSTRHTYSTLGVHLGLSGALVDETMNHVISGVRGVYQHGKNFSSHIPVFKQIQEKLIDVENGVIHTKKDNVLNLFKAA